MAMQASRFFSFGSGRKRPGAARMRVAAFWSVVGIVTVAAVLSVTLDAGLRQGTGSVAPTNLVAPEPAAYIPMTGEVDFHHRFADEKRNAKVEELPAQF